MKLMLCQYQIAWEDKETNIEKINIYLKAAREANVDLICLPEMSFTGFSMNVDITGEYQAETITAMRKLAKEYGVAIAFGYVRCQENHVKAENHYAVVDKDGVVLADYAKIHPFSYGGESVFFEGGNELVSFSFCDFNIGLAICYDLRFPEQFQLMGEHCDMILLPANWPASRIEHFQVLGKARAIENQCYMAMINCIGEMGNIEYSGNSLLVNPEGKVLLELLEEEYQIITIENDVDGYRTRFPVRNDRVSLQ